ncbi:MAG: 3-dehydroquinate synthase II [Candidatus Bathyarchaeia archaeon]
MRDFWVAVDETLSEEQKKSILQTAIASGSHVAVCSIEDVDLVRGIGLKAASTSEGDILILEEPNLEKLADHRKESEAICVRLTVRSREDEEKAVKAAEAGTDFLIVNCPDWKVIPIENLIAKLKGKTKLLAEVSSPSEARVALMTLELGVDGILLRTKASSEIEETAKVLVNFTPKDERMRIPLIPARVTGTKQLGLGHRVCVDTCDILAPDEGMLVGCQSSGLFLVQAEVSENPHVEPRPFRVNAGPVSLYILVPGNKTRYLSELRAGEEVLVVNRNGWPRPVVVARAKIERRPFVLVEVEVEGVQLKTVVQNAETIRLMTPNGSKPVTELEAGDEVLVHHQIGGRHFGALVSEESVLER